MPETTEVAIVGSGAAGCAVAYYLARAGVQVTIIEREGVGTQASGYSAGGLNPLQGAGIPGPLGPLAMACFHMHLSLWDLLRESTGIDYQGRVVSLVKVAFDQSDVPELQETLDLFTAAEGFKAQWLDPAEVHRLEPRISPYITRGLYTYGNAALDSYQYTLALASAAQQCGAKVRAGVVTGLERASNRIAQVLLADGAVSCGQVVLAMGPWSRKAEPWLDAYIPVDPLKGEILRLELPGPALGHDFAGGGGSLYHKPDGLVWCGATEEWRGFDRSTTDSARRSILQRAVRLMPDLAQARLAQQTACLRPVTPDWLPIVGQAPGWDNVYLATGAGKKGILLSPGIGKAVSDLLTRGATDLPIGPCLPDRFAPAVYKD